MTRRGLLIALGLLLLAHLTAAQVSDWREIRKPPLPEFHPQLPVRVVLPNGMVLLLQEDHELPLIDAIMRIRGGSRLEPASKVSLVSIYGSVWRTGGTTTRTGDQLDDFLEARAAKVETGGGADSTFISLSALKADFDDVFRVFLELLRQPAFREDKITLVQFQINTAISRRNDDIDAIAGRVSTQLAYGKQNPYARVAEYATVAAVTRNDLVQWHKTYVHPNNIILGIVGDFDAKAMETRLRQAFADWPKGPAAPTPQIEFAKAKPGVYFVAKDEVNQSEIRMVDLGIDRRNPDYFAVTVMNEAFGGGFASRLFTTLRTERGLAYSVGGGVGAAFDHAGITRVGMGTKSATTAEGIAGLQSELDRLVNSPPAEEEIQRAKDSILNAFVFSYDSKEKILREQMAYEYYGYPLDFLERYRAEVEKVSPADVARVARKYVHREQFATLIVGNPAEIGDQLKKFGPVTPMDITIPPPPAEAQKKPAASTSPAKPKATPGRARQPAPSRRK